MPTDLVPPGSRWTRPFAIDLRALGLLRIALGGILFVSLVLRVPLLGALQGDAAAFPIERAREFLFVPVSLHLLSGAMAYQAGLLGLAMVCALGVLVGYRTRLMTAVSWYLLLSLHHRCYHTQDVGDHLMRLLLLWSIFLPGGRRYSVDARRTGEAGAGWVCNMASAGMLLQVASLMFFAGLHKFNSPFWTGGEAVGLVLQDDMWVSPLGALLAPYSGLSRFFTYSTLVVEVVGPLLLLSPFASRGCRTVAVIVLGAFAIGIGASLPLGVIPWVVTVSLVPFVPSGAWDWFEGRIGRGAAPAARPVQRVTAAPLVNVLAGVLILQALVWSVDSLRYPSRIPLPLLKVGYCLGLGQAWTMYTPDPTPSSFRLHLRLDLADGEKVRLVIGTPREGWPEGEGLEALEDLWGTYRGMVLIDGIAYPEYAADLRPFLVWACRQWTLAHPDRPVVSAGLSKETRSVRHTPLGPGELFPLLTTEPLLGHLCSDHGGGPAE